ncbi:hypothetical protein EDC04DRAFT_2572981 [Pisolithus marmoratus]|nr:hypothetical protein EDC04DRAFT_2572981 [Pisolithus marmoratus]
MLLIGDHNRDGVAHTTKQHCKSSKEDVLEPIVVKAQKLVEHEGHPHTQDYDDMTQEFVMTVISDYHACLCAKGPMPDHTMETSLLDASWAQAHKVTGVNLACSPQLAKLIGNSFFFHGQLKTKLHPLVKAMFGFHSSQSKNVIKKNQALVEGLKEGTNFAFKHMSADEDGQWGFLKAPLIQKIINTMWFANKHDDGVVFHDYFKPFPLLALALVLVAIECCIDEWVTGTQTDIPFTIQEYHGAYKSHLKCLHVFKDATKQYNALPGICARLYEVGWCVSQLCYLLMIIIKSLMYHSIHSGAGPLSAPAKVTVSACIIATAIKEYEDGMTTKDKSD